MHKDAWLTASLSVIKCRSVRTLPRLEHLRLYLFDDQRGGALCGVHRAPVGRRRDTAGTASPGFTTVYWGCFHLTGLGCLIVFGQVTSQILLPA